LHSSVKSSGAASAYAAYVPMPTFFVVVVACANECGIVVAVRHKGHCRPALF
jgi:hypothetical protein